MMSEKPITQPKKKEEEMGMNIDLLKTEADREKLARELVAFLENDETEPVPDRNSWLGEKGLRDVESAAITNKLFEEFAKLSEQALQLSNEPTISNLFRLNRINGLRRLPEGKRDDSLLRALFDEAEESIAALNNSPRKNRLMSLWSYHAGIYARAVGDYLLAAESQSRSAELAEASGDPKSAVISRLCESYERINHALINQPDKVSEELAKERVVSESFYQALAGEKDSTSVRWKLLDGPIHLLLTHFWAGESYQGAADRDRLLQLKDADPDISKNYESAVSVALAVQCWNEGDIAKARDYAAGAIQGNFGSLPSAESQATAHLLLARIAAREGNEEEAKRRLLDAIAVKGSSFQVSAVAGRELAVLEK